MSASDQGGHFLAQLLKRSRKRQALCARGKPEVSAAQRCGGSDPYVTSAMVWPIVMSNGRTRSAGRYITFPDKQPRHVDSSSR